MIVLMSIAALALAAAVLALVAVQPLLAALPDSNEDFIFCGGVEAPAQSDAYAAQATLSRPPSLA